MRRKLTQAQWNIVAGKLMELGNLIFIGLVISQMVAGGRFNQILAIIGLVILIATYLVAFLLMKGGGKNKQ